MKRQFLFVAILFAVAQIAFAAEKSNRISPFSPDADSYAASVRSVFVNLPLVTDPSIIKSKVGGTEAMAKAELNRNFSGDLKYGAYKSIQIVGETNLEIRGPIDLNRNPTYLWIFTGRVQYFYYLKKNDKIEEPFFFVTHLETRYQERWETDCKLIGDESMIIGTDTAKNAAAVVSEPLRRKNLKTKHDEAIAKDEWEFSNRKVKGKLIGYKHGKVSIQDGSRAPFSLDVMKFSLDDQELIRAYIDHLGIPVRESSAERGKK